MALAIDELQPQYDFNLREALENDQDFFGYLVELGLVKPEIELQPCSWCGGMVFTHDSVEEDGRRFCRTMCYETIQLARRRGLNPEYEFDRKCYLPIHPVSELLEIRRRAI